MTKIYLKKESSDWNSQTLGISEVVGVVQHKSDNLQVIPYSSVSSVLRWVGKFSQWKCLLSMENEWEKSEKKVYTIFLSSFPSFQHTTPPSPIPIPM